MSIRHLLKHCSSDYTDIGKIKISDVILNKPGRLTSDEFDYMKTHATEGGNVIHSSLSDIEFKRTGKSVAQVALVVDETLFSRMHTMQDCRTVQRVIRKPLGNCGVPYDIFLLSDFEACYKNYRAVIFPVPVESPELERAMSLCRESEIKYLQSTLSNWTFTALQLRDFFVESGVFIKILLFLCCISVYFMVH